MADAKEVFLSFAPEDVDFAMNLARWMASQHASVTMGFNLPPEDMGSDVMRKRIEKASALVLLIPAEDGGHRNWVWFEAGAAKALGKRVLAVLPPGRKITELPSDVADILILDAYARPLENIADTLLQAVPERNDQALAH